MIFSVQLNCKYATLHTNMATTIDFKLDDPDTIDTIRPSTPASIKRKLKDIRSPDNTLTTNTSPLVTLRKQKDIPRRVISPEYKKRNILVDIDLDPDSKHYDSDDHDSIEMTASITMEEPTNHDSENDDGNNNNASITTQEPTDREKEHEGDNNEDCQTDYRPRRFSDPGLPSVENKVEDKVNHEFAMMGILLDIRSRIQNLEIKGKEMVTNTSLPKILCDMQKPIQAEIKQMKLKIDKHEQIFSEIENTQLSTESKIEITQTELKTHIQTTSAEYCDLKKTYTEDIIQIQDKMTATKDSITQSLDEMQKNADSLYDKYGKLAEKIASQEKEIRDINHLVSNNIQTRWKAEAPMGEMNLEEQDRLRRTHLDDMMRRSIVVEGVAERKGEDLTDLICDIAGVLNIHLYIGEISQVRRIGRYTRNQMQPRPIKVTFVGEIKRDTFLQRKRSLYETENYHTVIIYPDDRPEVRKFKAHLRMAANAARKRGDQVWQRYNAIIVNGQKYEYSNYTQLSIDFPYSGEASGKPPKTYSANAPDAPKTLEMLREARMKGENDMETQTSVKQVGTDKRSALTKIRSLTKDESDELIDSLGSYRSIQITPFGIGFFSGECLLSNHYKVKFVYNGRTHYSSEQAYFAECAIVAKDTAAFRQIMKTQSPRKAKSIGSRIVPGASWGYLKYDRMYEINYARFTQNEFLKEKLLSTRGFTLIECSTNSEWASGVNLDSPALTSGTWKGSNRHGFQLMEIREDIHRNQRSIELAEEAITITG